LPRRRSGCKAGANISSQRDAENREALSATLRTLRAESLRQTAEAQRLQQSRDEATRRANIADAAETAAKEKLRVAEQAIQKLKDEAARTKTQVAQTRAAWATETRRRDKQIEGLKKAVAEAGRARGERKGNGITTINVTGAIGGDDGQGSPGGSTSEDNYDLSMETNAFLAELARGLSEENETLSGLVRKTNKQLREMSGFSGDPTCVGDGYVTTLAGNNEEMSAQLEAVLQHLRTILTEPSFVPIEEVAVREDEINRLRDGWVKMETRWKEAVHLLDGWRKRMATSGRPVNMEELKMGLRLSPVRVRDVEETSQGLGLRLSTLEEVEEQVVEETPSRDGSLHLIPAPEYIEPDSDDESSIFEDEVDIQDLEVDEPNVQILEHSMMVHSTDLPPLPPMPQITPLTDSASAANRGAAANARGRKGADFTTTIVEERTQEIKQAAAPNSAAPPAQPAKRPSSPQKQAKPASRTAPSVQDRMPRPASAASTASTDSVSLVKTADPSPAGPSARPSSSTTSSASTKRQPGHDPSPRQVAKPIPKPISKPKSTATATRKAETKPVPRPTAASAAMNRSNTKTDTASPLPPPKAPTTKPATATTDMPPPPRPTSARTASPPKPTRLPLPRGLAVAPPQSPLTTATIAAKLAASERDADAARVRAKLKAARAAGRRDNSNIVAPPLPPPTMATVRAVRGEADEGLGVALPPVSREEEDELAGSVEEETAPQLQQQQQPPRKRERRASRVASRRRSTLNPWELESLIAGGV
jgi:hypothetical protein